MTEPPSQQIENDQKIGLFSLPAMRYPNGYAWFLFFASLDIMLTWAILNRKGTELNPVAWAVIKSWGLPGAIIFKFSLMLAVIIICEIVGRQRDKLGCFVAWTAVVISAMPVFYSLGLLVWHTYSQAR